MMRGATESNVIAFSTGSLYSYALARVFELAKEAGFEGIEVLVDRRWDTRQASYLNRLKEKHGLPIVSIHTPVVPAVPGWPASSADRCRRTVALAEEVAARLVVIHAPPRFSDIWI